MGIDVYVVGTGSQGAAAGSRRGLGLPDDVRKRATSLLAQQFWCFGCDIRRPEGNVLLAEGFVKHRSPESAAITSSRYTRCFEGSRSIVLWGFGLAWIDNEEVLFLPRHAMVPLYGCCECDTGNVWVPEEFGSLRRPTSIGELLRSRGMLMDALQWIQTYETRVAATYGVAYRAASLAAWKRPACSAEQIVGEWTAVIQRFDAAWFPEFE